MFESLVSQVTSCPLSRKCCLTSVTLFISWCSGQQPQSAPKAQVFVTAAPVKTEPVESSLMPPPATPVTIKAEPSPGDTDPPSMALLKLHELAVANKLVERLVFMPH